MKNKWLIITFLFTFTVLGFSQERTGNIYGKVTDESNTGLPGILITLSGDFIGKMTTLSDNAGNYRFISLSPGEYQLRAELDGYATIIRKGINVRLGENLSVTLMLVPKKLEEEVIVVATPMAIDSKKTTHATNLSKDELQTLPTARDPFVILELTPGLAMDRANVGGSESGQQSNFVSRGSGRSSSNWSTDGINVTDQVSTGSAPQYYDFDAFEEIQIQTAGNDITSMTAGAQINMITKRGGNKFSGGGRFYLTDKSFQGNNIPDDFNKDLTPAQIHSIKDMGINIGGPIIRDKLWFWAGGAIQDIQKRALVGDLQKQKLNNIEVKVNTILGNHRIETFFNWSSKDITGRISNSHLDAWESHYIQKSPHPFYKIQDEFTVNDNLFLSAKLSHFRGGFLLTPIGGVGGTSYRDNELGRYLGTYRESDYIRLQYFGQLSGVYFAENLFGASHEIKFGAEYKLSPGKRKRTYESQRLRYKDYEDPTSAYRAYIYRNSDYDYNMDRMGFFIQDSITAGNLTVLLGLRYDIQGASVNALDVEGSSVDWAGEYNLPAVHVDAQDLNVKWKTFSPRVGLIYNLGGKGKTLLKANFGIYGTHFDSDFPYNLASTYGYVYFDWEDLNLDRKVQAGEVSKPRVRDSFNQLDASEMYDENLTSPKTLEITAGVEQELFEDVAVGFNVIYRKNYNDYYELKYVEENGVRRLPTPDDWEIGGYMDAEYGGYAWWQYKEGIEQTTTSWFTQRPDYYTKYLALELTFKKRLSSRSHWMVNGSFTFQNWKSYYPSRESWGNNFRPTNHAPVDLLGGQPAGYVSSSSGSSNASINPRWMAKLGFVVNLPLKINLGGTFTARDGYIAPKGYTDFDIDIRGNEDSNPFTYLSVYGAHRLANSYMLNLRLERTFKVSFARVVFSLDLFNVFNTSTTIDEGYNAARPTTFEKPLMITSPRIFRLGMRFNF